MKRIFIRFEANKMALFACFASKRISNIYMRNEFRPEANFCFKRIFEAKCSEYFVTEPNIAEPNLKVHCPLPTVIAYCPLPIVYCLFSFKNVKTSRMVEKKKSMYVCVVKKKNNVMLSRE